MWLRVLLAGIVGGVLMFFMGATNHMVFGLMDRAMLRFEDEGAKIDQIREWKLKPGLYAFPEMPANATREEWEKMYDEVNAKYKAGPAGMLLIAPPGHDMMTSQTLLMEAASNVMAALMAAWIVSLMGVEIGFGRRWVATLLIGLVGWCSLTASYGIWYRFPHEFVHDELFCVVIEWGVAGLAIAEIVRRRPAVPELVAAKV